MEWMVEGLRGAWRSQRGRGGGVERGKKERRGEEERREGGRAWMRVRVWVGVGVGERIRVRRGMVVGEGKEEMSLVWEEVYGIWVRGGWLAGKGYGEDIGGSYGGL